MYTYLFLFLLLILGFCYLHHAFGKESFIEGKQLKLMNENEKNTIILRQGYNRKPTDITNLDKPSNERIDYPDYDDIVRYDGPGCYKNSSVRNGENKITKLEKRYDICRPYTNSEFVEGNVNIIETKTYLDVNENADTNIELYAPKLYMNSNGYLRGINYAEETIGGEADVDQIGSIPLRNNGKEPMPVISFSV